MGGVDPEGGFRPGLDEGGARLPPGGTGYASGATPYLMPETPGGMNAQEYADWKRKVEYEQAKAVAEERLYQQQQEQQKKQRQLGIIATANRNVGEDRPGYTRDLGDSKTKQYVDSLRQTNPGASDEQLLGMALEQQRIDAYNTPTKTDDRFYDNELQRWVQNKVERSAGYHSYGMALGIPIAANPYEYQGDLAVEFLKGSPGKASEWFSPVSGQMSMFLPGGMGLQEYAWNNAVSYDRNQPAPEKVSYMNAVTALNSAEGLYGPYGELYGGKPDTRSILDGQPTSDRLIGGKKVAGTITVVDKETGMVVPYISKAAETKYAYRNDPIAIALEAAAFMGDSLTFGLWKPGKEQLTKYGQTSEDREYGAFSEWSQNIGMGIQTSVGIKEPWTQSQFTQFEQSPAFSALSPQTQFGEGVVKVIATNPASLGGSAIQGVEISAITGGVGYLIGAAAPAEGVAATTIVQKAGAMGSKAFPWVNTALGVGFISYGVGESTGWGTLPRSQAVSNLGGMTVNLAAMGAGTMIPEGITSIKMPTKSLKTIEPSPAPSPLISPEPKKVPAIAGRGFSVDQMSTLYNMKRVPADYGVPKSYRVADPTDFLYNKNPMAGGTTQGFKSINEFIPKTSVQKMIESKSPTYNLYKVDPTIGVPTTEMLGKYGRGEISPIRGNLETIEGTNIHKLKGIGTTKPERIGTEKIQGTNIYRSKLSKSTDEIERGGSSGGVVGNVGSRGGVSVDVGSGRLTSRSRSISDQFTAGGSIGNELLFRTGVDYEKVSAGMSNADLAPYYARRYKPVFEESEVIYSGEIPGVTRPSVNARAENQLFIVGYQPISRNENERKQETLVSVKPAFTFDTRVSKQSRERGISRQYSLKEKTDQEISIKSLTLPLILPVTMVTPKSTQSQVTVQTPTITPTTTPKLVLQQTPTPPPPPPPPKRPKETPPILPPFALPLLGSSRSPGMPGGRGAFAFKEVSPAWTPGEMGRSLFTGSFTKPKVTRTRLPKLPKVSGKRGGKNILKGR